jgi:hypothetical protein
MTMLFISGSEQRDVIHCREVVYFDSLAYPVGRF